MGRRPVKPSPFLRLWRELVPKTAGSSSLRRHRDMERIGQGLDGEVISFSTLPMNTDRNVHKGQDNGKDRPIHILAEQHHRFISII